MKKSHLIKDTCTKLTELFIGAASPKDAHLAAAPFLQQVVQDPSFTTEVIRQSLKNPKFFNKENYPVVAFEIEQNAHYTFVANGWIPYPDANDSFTTKAVHHHGELLLTTVTGFGPGYEHWTFTVPKRLEGERFKIEVTSRAMHKLYDSAFVDAYEPHVPFYPADLTITFALWSHQRQVSWKDYVKRWPIWKGYEKPLAKIVKKLDVITGPNVNPIEYFDFYPTDEGMFGMENRIEYERGPVQDYLTSLFYLIQKTGNSHLVPEIKAHVGTGKLRDEAHVHELVAKLELGQPIDGKLSDCHFDVGHINFTRDQVLTAIGQPTTH